MSFHCLLRRLSLSACALFVTLCIPVAVGAAGPQDDAERSDDNPKSADKDTVAPAELVRALQAQYAQQLTLLKKQEELLKKYQPQVNDNVVQVQRQLAAAQAAYLAAVGASAQDAERVADYVTKVRAHYAQLAQADGAQVPPYWIGVQCEPSVEIPLLSDIPGVGNVFRKGGLRVSTLTPNSPAAKADIKVGDVIISAGGTNTNTIAELMEAIGKSKSKDLTIRIIRDKKPLEIKVRPEKRPANTDPRISAYRAYNRGLAKPLYSYYSFARPFPKDLTITFEKQGSAAAKIRAQRGDKSWEVGEDELGKLPPEIRVYAERLVQATKAASPPKAYAAHYYSRTPSGWTLKSSTPKPDAVEKKIDALGRELEKLRKALEELKQRDG